MSDDDFLSAFETCTLPASAWTHEAHVRLGLVCVKRWPYETALERVRIGINRFNDAVLRKELAYHDTITVAFCRLIADACRKLNYPRSSPELEDLKMHFPELFDRKLSALLRHYRHATLFSDLARASFVEPDLVPLPKVSEQDDCTRS